MWLESYEITAASTKHNNGNSDASYEVTCRHVAGAGEHTHKYGAQISVSAGPLRWRLFARRGDEGERDSVFIPHTHTHEGGVRLLVGGGCSRWRKDRDFGWLICGRDAD